MKTLTYYTIASLLGAWLFLSGSLYGQTVQDNQDDTQQATPIDDNQNTDDGSKKEPADPSKPSFSVVAGAVTVDGINYQQIGVRGDFPIGKLGLGLDLQLLLDDQGNIRKEDWDEGVDYMDKLYYIRWGQKGDPFYTKVGGLDRTTLGYGSIVYGYSNMVEYPTYKRVGLEVATNLTSFGFEYFMNDFKELTAATPSMLTGGRLFVKPFGGFLQVGGSFVSDLNQYNGLRDNDGDGYPDAIDYEPYDSRVVTEADSYRVYGVSETAILELQTTGRISSIERDQLLKISDNQEKATIYGADIGLRFIDTEKVKLSIYGEWAQVYETKGWGFAAPGLDLVFGPLNFNIAYRQSKDKFLFAYFNNTYELERAIFVAGTNGAPVAQTKLDSLENVTGKEGVFASFGLNLFSLIDVRFDYQLLMRDGAEDDQSITGELGIAEGLIPKVSEVNAYYTQNNVTDLTEWKTPSTILGYRFGIEASPGVVLVFDTRYTFNDANGDGKIGGDDETDKTFSISTEAKF